MRQSVETIVRRFIRNSFEGASWERKRVRRGADGQRETYMETEYRRCEDSKDVRHMLELMRLADKYGIGE